MRGAALAALAVVLFGLLATANAGGYRFGISDQAFYVPAVASTADPTLFPRDRAVLQPQMRLWAGGAALAQVVGFAGGSMPVAFLALYLLTLTLLATGALALGRALGLGEWALAALLLLLTLRHQITRTGTNSLESYMHPRMLAFGIGLFVLGAVVRQRHGRAALLTALAALIHITTGAWFAVILAVAVAWHQRHASAQRWVLGSGLALAVAAAALAWVRLPRMDAAWLSVLDTRSYLFPDAWPLSAWLLNLAYPAVIVAVHYRRRRLALTRPGEDALVAGAVALCLAFVAALPFIGARVALVVQGQVARVFWILDALTAVYVAWWLTQGRAHAALPRIVVGLLAAMAIGRGGYLHAQTGRPLVEVSPAATPWTDVMHWLSRQPTNWHVLADPGHAWKFGSSIRVAARRDTPLELGKDPAMALYDQAVATRVRERTTALGGFDEFGVADIRRLDAFYDLDVFVDASARALPLPVLYRNAEFVVYDLR